MRKGMSFAEAGRLGGQRSRKRGQQKKQERIVVYNEDPRKCENCENAILYEKRKNRYCSKSCAAQVNNQGVSRNYKTGQATRKPCLNCDKETTNIKYCSTNCHQAYVWEVVTNKIREGKNANINSKVSPSIPKRYLLETRGRECEMCGRKNWNRKPIPIVLDHIDGDSTNWELKNLRLICPNCDAQTDTYKGKNAGNGRHWRRQRYKEGKSY